MAEQKKVILHGMWASPYVKRVELALKLKGIPYEYVEEDLSNKSDLLLEYNPVYKKVPVLVHDGKPISESNLIIEYIDETWKHGPQLLPQDPYKRAQLRFWVKFLQEPFETILVIIKTEGQAQEQAIKELHEKLALLENGMKEFFPNGNPCVDDNNVGLLEIACVVFFGAFKVHEEFIGIKLIDPEKFPLLFSWLLSITELQAVKELAPPHQKVVDLLHFIRQKALKSTAA
ncbi:hypothetical protein L6164_011169 [Bauhinia variegata]|uniref:Uncharacterized protein n=1 Tax=Bauhinia variegata TaxID=167791 RepID=A0ACB9P6A9_BAUVA|nr:hypothetical protein L6164_011169 [Bauhinia variegata]